MTREIRRRWRGLVTIALLVTLAGGVTLAAFAGARRTKSSFSRFTKWGRSQDVLVLAHDLHAKDVAAVRAMPEIDTVGLARFMAVLQPNGQLLPTGFSNVGALDEATYHSVDRLRIVHGRAAAPNAPDELVLGEPLARVMHLHVGDTLRIASYTPAQTAVLTGGNPPSQPAGPRVALRIVGIGRGPSDLSLQSVAGGNLLLSRAFVQRYGNRIGNLYGPNGVIFVIRLRHGAAGVPSFVTHLGRVLPQGSFDLDPVALSYGGVQQSIDVLAVALLVFGTAAAIAGLIAVAMVISRHIGVVASTYTPVRDLGMSRRSRAIAIAGPVLAAVGAGTMAAVALAWLASPLLPFGVARDAEPTPGLQFDVLVIVIGAAAIALIVGAITAALAWRAARLTPAATTSHRTSWLARALERSRLGAPATVGARMAFEPARRDGRVTGAPIWPALAGASVAIVGVVGVAVFSASLRHVVATPSAYGQAWQLTVYDARHQPPASRPCTPVRTPVAADPAIEAIALACAQNVTIDGRATGAISVVAIRGQIAPTVLEGRLPRTRNEAALGTDTLHALHRRIGDTIVVTSTRAPARYRIVGRVIVPSLSETNPQAIADGAVFSGAGLNRVSDLSGNTTISLAIALRSGVDHTAAVARVTKLAGVADANGPFTPTSGVAMPLEVVRLRQIHRVPDVLALFLALLGAIALGHLLVTTVRQQRRTFAVLKSIGFDRRQLMVTVASEATTVVGLAVIVGIVVGALAGSFTWRAVAHDVGVVPGVTAPIALVLVVAVIALVVANLLATLPARAAARTPAAAILRTE